MKPARALPGRISGMSLVELMVSLTIGLILMVAVVSAYLGSSGAARIAEAQGRMNEDGQAALSVLVQQLRMAGNNPKQPNRTRAEPRNPVYIAPGTSTVANFTTTYYSLRGCEGKFSDIQTASSLDNLTCAGTASTDPDSIAVSYEADKFNTVPTSGGTPTDCLGQSLPGYTATVVIATGPTTTATTGTTYYVADNRFFVTTTTALSPSLYCKGNGGAAQPLVENIEDVQFTYGTSPAGTSTTTVGGYLDAVGVETNSATDSTGATLAGLGALGAIPAKARQWGRVMTVRICVLVRSEGTVAADAASARYTRCDGTVNTSPPDLRLRRAYSTTVVLRNRLY